MVSKQITAKQTTAKLINDLENTNIIIQPSNEKVIRNAFRRIFENLSNDHKRNKLHDKLGGRYHFIPNDPSYILRDINLATLILLKYKPSYDDIKFLDVGCGYGNVMQIAGAFGLDIQGIEYDKEIVKIGRMMFRVPHSDKNQYIIQGNALTFKDYKKYDIIYYYCPFEDSEKQRRLEKKIENDMHVGAIMICEMKQGYDHENGGRFKRIRDNIYMKVKD